MKRTVDKEIILLALLSCAWILGLVTGWLHPVQVMVASALETALSCAVAFSLSGFSADEEDLGSRIGGFLGGGLMLVAIGLFPAMGLLGSEFGVDAEGNYTMETLGGISEEGLAMCAALVGTYLWIFFDRKRRLESEGLQHAGILLGAPPFFTWFFSIPVLIFHSAFAGAIVHEIVRPTLHVLLKFAKQKLEEPGNKKLTRVFFSPKFTKPAKKTPPAMQEPGDTEMYEKFSAYGQDPTDEPK